MKKFSFFFLLNFFIAQFSSGQSPQILKIREYANQREDSIMKEFFTFLSFPNVATDTTNIQKNAAFITQMMNKRGIQNIQLLTARTAGVPPAVYGEVAVPGARQTIIFYAHYDGQPVNPAQWAKGLNPFQPKLFSAPIDKGGTSIPFPSAGHYDREWRMYARSASDDKAGVDAILNAYDAVKKSGLQPTSNVK